MSDSSNDNDTLLEAFLYETNQLLNELEEILLSTEEKKSLTEDNINEIFRIMHTIKGSAAMMTFDNISKTAHAVEDLFYFIRENKPQKYDFENICDVVLHSLDYIRLNITKVQSGEKLENDEDELLKEIGVALEVLKSGAGTAAVKPKGTKSTGAKAKTAASKAKTTDAGAGEATASPVKKSAQRTAASQKYKARIVFEDSSQMENLRAYSIMNGLQEHCSEMFSKPADLTRDETADYIAKNGFELFFETDVPRDKIENALKNGFLVKSYQLETVDDYDQEIGVKKESTAEHATENKKSAVPAKSGAVQELVSVSTSKLDSLMDLVGEIVITESMVTRNPDLKGLNLDNFDKTARQLRKLTDDLQDIVMSMRMVPIAPVFHRMHRIVRDMNKSLGKDVELVLKGEDTEVDKSIVDKLSDPLMHLVRNSMDHGIESAEVRKQAGKDPAGKVRLSARNTGGDIVITISDDGKGLDKAAILKKAKEAGLLEKPENELTEKEIFSFIMLPGFSTSKKVTEYSGRGVGMDVVRQNVEKVGGKIAIESAEGKGTNFIIRIPLTLAIVDGMEIAVGNSVYIIPIVSIKESFKAQKKALIRDTAGNEMIMVRGNCYPILRLHKLFGVKTEKTDLCDGILIMVENDGKVACLFADDLLGEQQIVVKSLPYFLNAYDVKKSGIGGCTILGDGSISLIIDVAGILDRLN